MSCPSSDGCSRGLIREHVGLNESRIWYGMTEFFFPFEQDTDDTPRSRIDQLTNKIDVVFKVGHNNDVVLLFSNDAEVSNRECAQKKRSLYTSIRNDT